MAGRQAGIKHLVMSGLQDLLNVECRETKEQSMNLATTIAKESFRTNNRVSVRGHEEKKESLLALKNIKET